MIINWYKYIREMLPTRLRLVQLVEFIRVMVWQVPVANTAFDLFLADANYKVNVNASVIALERLIQYELDAIATIEELDGKSFDFMVNVHSAVDEKRLKALINNYKLAGKTFAFKLGAVVYSAEYINHVCEDIITVFGAEYIDHVCEQDGENEIQMFLGFTEGGKILVSAHTLLSAPVKSELTISGQVVGWNSENQAVVGGGFSLTIPVDGTTGSAEVDPNAEADSYTLSPAITITPNSDEYYNYSIQ